MEALNRPREVIRGRQRALYELVRKMVADEGSNLVMKRRKLGISLTEFPVLVKSERHMSKCYRDGRALVTPHEGPFESTVIGGMELPVEFIRYKAVMAEKHKQVEFRQCSGCHLLYQMPLSPAELRRIKRQPPIVFGGAVHSPAYSGDL